MPSRNSSKKYITHQPSDKENINPSNSEENEQPVIILDSPTKGRRK
jgi:hypothetical protein